MLRLSLSTDAHVRAGQTAATIGSLSSMVKGVADGEIGWRRAFRWYRSKILARLGYREDHWVRVVYIDHWKAHLRSLPLGTLDALEVSPGYTTHWRDIGFRSYEGLEYPHFDITKDALPRQFDVILAENVFEHLEDPVTALRNVGAILRPNGLFLIETPFLIRVHFAPGSYGDYTRWTPMR
jgi:SAM-dependent methyltransferase